MRPLFTYLSTLATAIVFKVLLATQLPKELPHVSHHQLGLFPEGEVATARHFGVVNQIEISRHHTVRRIINLFISR